MDFGNIRDRQLEVFHNQSYHVFASLSMGMGADRAKNLCEHIILSALHHKSFQHHANDLYNPTEEACAAIFDKTAEIVKREHLQCPLDDKSAEDSTETEPLYVNIAVSYDGSWLTRGHTSFVGIGCVIDILTGYVLDAHVMSSYCLVCKRIEAMPAE